MTVKEREALKEIENELDLLSMRPGLQFNVPQELAILSGKIQALREGGTR